MAPTIGDVAREAGVSRSTVSYVLSGERPISQQTKDRVAAAIEKLNFTVNAGARALATARTMTLGVAVRFHYLEFQPALATYLVGLADAARTAGYELQLMTEPDDVPAIRRAMARRQVDGIVLMDVLEHDPRLAPLAEAHYPASLVGIPLDAQGINAADLDFERAAADLVTHLYEHGHRSAILVPVSPTVMALGAAYGPRFRDAALARAKALGMEIAVEDCPSGSDAARDALRRIVSQPGDNTALMVHNDAAIAMLPGVLNSAGVDVPGALSVVSLHSAELADFFGIPYTYMESRPVDVTAAAVNLLVSQLAGDQTTGKTVLLPATFRDRGSVSEL